LPGAVDGLAKPGDERIGCAANARGQHNIVLHRSAGHRFEVVRPRQLEGRRLTLSRQPDEDLVLMHSDRHVAINEPAWVTEHLAHHHFGYRLASLSEDRKCCSRRGPKGWPSGAGAPPARLWPIRVLCLPHATPPLGQSSMAAVGRVGSREGRMHESLETPDGCIVAYAQRLGLQDGSGGGQGSRQPRVRLGGLDRNGDRRRGGWTCGSAWQCSRWQESVTGSWPSRMAEGAPDE